MVGGDDKTFPSYKKEELFYFIRTIYKNTSLKIRAENNGENNDLLFRTKENLRTTKPWIQFTWFLQK